MASDMVADNDPMNAAFLRGLQLKEQARKSLDHIDLFLEAAERLHEAAVLGEQRQADPAHPEEARRGAGLLTPYYYYEEQSCLAFYFYEKRDTDEAGQHLEKAAALLNEYIRRLEAEVQNTPNQSTANLLSLLDTAKFYRHFNTVWAEAIPARAAWDGEQFIDALDRYRRMATQCEGLVEHARRLKNPAYERIAFANTIGILTNCSAALAQHHLMIAGVPEGEEGKVIPFDLACDILRHLYKAYLHGMKAFEANPEWIQYRDGAMLCRRNIEESLAGNKNVWAAVYARFLDEPEFLKIMAAVDMERYQASTQTGSVEEREKVTENDLQVVLLIHGIRTQADWQEMVAHKLEQEGRIRVIPIRYDYFDAFRFWCPVFTRSSPIKRVLKEIRVVRDQHPNAKLSVIAHSFGTYVIGAILQKEFDIKFYRIVLCGSVLPRAFAWERLLRQIEPDQVVNECGKKDIWPVLAQCLSWGYGASGTHGFGAALLKDRFHDSGHSQYFDPQFVDDHWIPLIQRGEYKRTVFEANRPTSPWWLSCLGAIPIQNCMVAAVVLLLILLVPTLTTVFRQPAKPDETLQPVLADNLDISDVTFMEYEGDARAPRLDLKLTNMGKRSAFVKRVNVNVKKVWRLRELPLLVGTVVPPEHNYVVRLLPRDEPFQQTLKVSHGIKPDEFGRFTVQFEEDPWPNANTIYYANMEIVVNGDDVTYKTKDLMFLITQRGTAFPDKKRIDAIVQMEQSLGREVEKSKLIETVTRNKVMILEGALFHAERNPALLALIETAKKSDIEQAPIHK